MKNLVETFEEAKDLAQKELGKYLRHTTGRKYPSELVNDYVYDEMFNHLTYLILSEEDNRIGKEKMNSLCHHVYKIYEKFLED